MVRCPEKTPGVQNILRKMRLGGMAPAEPSPPKKIFKWPEELLDGSFPAPQLHGRETQDGSEQTDAGWFRNARRGDLEAGVLLTGGVESEQALGRQRTGWSD